MTSSGHDPLASESDNYEVISVSDEEVRKSVTVIPKLETLVSRVVLQIECAEVCSRLFVCRS